MKAVGYRRVSTAQQLEGEGLAIQTDRIDGWCRFAGVPLSEVFEDAGISGASTDNRPGFRNAVRAALALGAQGTLVVYKLDRLGRNALDIQETLAVLLDEGVRVVSVSDGLDSASGMGAALLRLLCGILATFAELEKETIRTRLLDGRRRADRENRTYASEPRYGRRAADDSGTLVNDAAEQAAIARVLHLRNVEGLSYRAICARLDTEGARPRRAKAWSPAVVHRICTGRRAAKKTATSKRLERARSELVRGEPEQAA